MHILLIEDDINAASYVIKGLKESGHVVDRASDGKEGLFMALDSNFDALIVDRMLPELDGVSLISRIREKNWQYYCCIFKRQKTYICERFKSPRSNDSST